jgi:hypothetical protein
MKYPLKRIKMQRAKNEIVPRGKMQSVRNEIPSQGIMKCLSISYLISPRGVERTVQAAAYILSKKWYLPLVYSTKQLYFAVHQERTQRSLKDWFIY